MSSHKIFVTGIDTNIGKTIVSAILVEALKADYWKPVQAGDLESSDSKTVAALISNKKSNIHAEAFRLQTAMSPHYAAYLDKVKIVLKDIHIPETSNNLIIEGAGGVMSPINFEETNLDLIKHVNAKTILVSKNYLGSINHTLMSIELLKKNNVDIVGIIFNGKSDEVSEEYILKYSGLELLGRVSHQQKIEKEFIMNYADQLKPILKIS